MRIKLFLLLSGLCGAVYAAQPLPSDLQPLQPPPPPPPLNSGESPDEPQVTITKNDEWTVEEFRMGGWLYMVKITPKVGPPYYLVDDRGDGRFSRQDSLDSGVRPPRWIIHRF